MDENTNRRSNGQFGAGNRASPGGRGGKTKRSPAEEVTNEFGASIPITENGKRKNVSKLAANAKQLANKGASGDIRAAKMVLDFAMKAEKEREPAPPLQVLTENDHTIVLRFIERLKLNHPNNDPGEEKPDEAKPGGINDTS